jgi:hypothetical protein
MRTSQEGPAARNQTAFEDGITENQLHEALVLLADQEVARASRHEALLHRYREINPRAAASYEDETAVARLAAAAALEEDNPEEARQSRLGRASHDRWLARRAHGPTTRTATRERTAFYYRTAIDAVLAELPHGVPMGLARGPTAHVAVELPALPSFWEFWSTGRRAVTRPSGDVDHELDLPYASLFPLRSLGVRGRPPAQDGGSALDAVYAARAAQAAEDARHDDVHVGGITDDHLLQPQSPGESP